MTIWKFPLEIKDTQVIQMPAFPQILSCMMQDNRLTVWALVNEKHRKYGQVFNIVGTGHPAGSGLGRFIASVQDGPFVWHVFDGGPA